MNVNRNIVKGKRVVIYNRCSTEELEQVKALETQAQESREIAESLGWTIVRQFIEPKSGTESEHRYEYRKLYDSLESGDYDIIMVKSQDRLMRNDLEWNLFCRKMLECEKQLYFYIDRRFYNHENDFLLYGFTSKMNEAYSVELSKKIKNAHKRRQKNCSGVNISRPMFGWDKIATNQYVVNEKEAEAIRDAFEMVRAGIGFHKIANIMYERGYRSKGTGGNKNLGNGMISGTWWRKNCIYDPRMHGEMILHKDEKNFFTKKRVPVPKEEWIHYKNALPAIVSEEYQEETIAILQKRIYKAERVDRTLIGKHLYSNKIVCKNCGCFFYRYKTKSGKDGELLNWKCREQNQFGRVYCNNIIVEELALNEHIDREIRARFDKLFTSETSIVGKALKYVERALKDDSGTKEVDGLKAKLSQHQRKKEVLFDKLMSETINDADFQLFNCKLDGEIKELENRISDIENRKSLYGKLEQRIEKMKRTLQEGKAEKEAILAEVKDAIDRIEVDNTGELTIHFDNDRFLSILGVYNVLGDMDALDESVWEIRFMYHRETKVEQKRRITNEKVLETFRENPRITIEECATILNEKYSYVYTSVAQLREEGQLEYKRINFNQSGIWVINEQN